MADEKASAKVLDMSNVAEGGGQRFNPKRMKEGDYLARIMKVQDAESKKDGAFQWLFTIALESTPSAKYPYYCKLQENQLWKIRNLLVAAGINVPKKKVKLDPEKVVGKLIAVTLEDDEYDGKLKSVIASIFPPADMNEISADDADDIDDEVDEDEEVEEAPASAKADVESEDDDDEDEDEDEEPAPPVAKKKAKAKREVTDDELEELDIEDV